MLFVVVYCHVMSCMEASSDAAAGEAGNCNGGDVYPVIALKMSSTLVCADSLLSGLSTPCG